MLLSFSELASSETAVDAVASMPASSSKMTIMPFSSVTGSVILALPSALLSGSGLSVTGEKLTVFASETSAISDISSASGASTPAGSLSVSAVLSMVLSNPLPEAAASLKNLEKSRIVLGGSFSSVGVLLSEGSPDCSAVKSSIRLSKKPSTSFFSPPEVLFSSDIVITFLFVFSLIICCRCNSSQAPLRRD